MFPALSILEDDVTPSSSQHLEVGQCAPRGHFPEFQKKRCWIHFVFVDLLEGARID